MKKITLLMLVAVMCLFDASAKKIRKEPGKSLLYGTISYSYERGNARREGMPKELLSTRGITVSFVSLDGDDSVTLKADNKGEIVSTDFKPGKYKIFSVRYERDSDFYSYTYPPEDREDLSFNVEEGKVTNLSALYYCYNDEYNFGVISYSSDYEETKEHFEKIYKNSEWSSSEWINGFEDEE